jgi:hypothetical protein
VRLPCGAQIAILVSEVAGFGNSVRQTEIATGAAMMMTTS